MVLHYLTLVTSLTLKMRLKRVLATKTDNRRLKSVQLTSKIWYPVPYRSLIYLTAFMYFLVLGSVQEGVLWYYIT